MDKCALCGSDNASVNIKDTDLDICNSCLHNRTDEIPGLRTSYNKGEIPAGEMDDTSLIEELATLDVDKDTYGQDKECNCQKPIQPEHKRYNEQVTVTYGEVVITERGGDKAINVSYSAGLLAGETLESAYERAWGIVKAQIAKQREIIIAEFGIL